MLIGDGTRPRKFLLFSAAVTHHFALMIAAAVLLTIARTTLAPHAPRAAMCSVYLSRCHTACVPVRSVAALMQSAEEPPKLIPKKFSWQVTLSGAVCAALLWHLSTSRVPPLFALHVACMAPMLPLGTASITTVRQRLLMPNPPTDAAKDWRRKRAEWLVIRHFIASAAALYFAAVGLGGIWLHKQSLSRAHLTTAHSWMGMVTWLSWLAAYAAAQPQVWRDQWKARRFSLFSNKRWLWASLTHRQFGTLAYTMSLVTYCTGMLGWRALDRRTSLVYVAAVAAIAKGMLNERSATEAAQAISAVATSPVRASRAVVAGLARSRPPSMLEEDAPLEARLRSMQARNLRNGQLVLGMVFVLIVWIFTLPPRIRRSREGVEGLWTQVQNHYASCGTEISQPCFQLDLSIDPTSVDTFAAFTADPLATLRSSLGL